MLTVGVAPYLECSTKGDTRFSPFYAKVHTKVNGERTTTTIEVAYHARKILVPKNPPLFGPTKLTNLSWQRAKELQKSGWILKNPKACAALYAEMWDKYMQENRHLLDVLAAQSGLSDMFGQRSGNVCQVIELWRIRSAYLAGTF